MDEGSAHTGDPKATLDRGITHDIIHTHRILLFYKARKYGIGFLC